MKKLIEQFLDTTNAFDVEASLQLFTENAVIDDISVGKKFKGKEDVRDYLETFFVGYKTKTKLDSSENINAFTVKTKVDFTGDFGHEKGGLDFMFNEGGLIEAIYAYLD